LSLAPSAPIPVSISPDLMLFDSRWLWIASQTENAVQAIDPVSGTTRALVAVSDSPLTLATDGKRLWVMLPTSRVQAVDLTADAEHASPPLNIGICPECFPSSALGFDGKYLWAGAGDDTARAIDPVTGKVVDSRTVGWLSFGSMVFDGKCMWLALSDGSLTRGFDPGSEQCRLTSDPMLPAGPLAFDGSRLWAASPDHGLLVALDVNSGQMEEGIEVGHKVNALAFDGSRLWVAGAEEDRLQAIDAATGQVCVSLSFPHPNALAFDGMRVWIADVPGRAVRYVAGVSHASTRIRIH
jgi:outer membrane protein assembly factor BamB